MDLEQLGLSWTELGLLIVSALGIYAGIIALTRIVGPRSVASISTFDLAVTVAVGAIVGRVVLARVSLLGGLVGLSTLFAVEVVIRRLRNRTALSRVIDPRPVLLVVDGQVRRDALRRHGLVLDDVHVAVRQHGLGRLRDVAAVVLERNGTLSVVPAGTELDPEVLADVRGWSP